MIDINTATSLPEFKDVEHISENFVFTRETNDKHYYITGEVVYLSDFLGKGKESLFYDFEFKIKCGERILNFKSPYKLLLDGIELYEQLQEFHLHKNTVDLLFIVYIGKDHDINEDKFKKFLRQNFIGKRVRLSKHTSNTKSDIQIENPFSVKNFDTIEVTLKGIYLEQSSTGIKTKLIEYNERQIGLLYFLSEERNNNSSLWMEKPNEHQDILKNMFNKGLSGRNFDPQEDKSVIWFNNISSTKTEIGRINKEYQSCRLDIDKVIDIQKEQLVCINKNANQSGIYKLTDSIETVKTPFK